MNMRQIEIFRAIMLTGSFTAAADMLHVTQPGVSRAARRLENDLGVALFERAHGRVRPTPEARALQAEIDRTYRGVNAIDQFAAALRTGAHTIIRAAGSPALGLEVLPAAAAALIREHPAAVLSVEVLGRTMQMVDELVAEHVDIVVSATEPQHPLVATRTVGEWTMVCVFPHGHPLGQNPFQLEAALSHPLVTFHEDALQARIAGRWFADLGMAPEQRIRVRSGEMACALVAAGAGITFVDNITARAYQTRGLDRAEVDVSPRFPIHAAWNVNRPLGELSLQLLQHVQDELQRN